VIKGAFVLATLWAVATPFAAADGVLLVNKTTTGSATRITQIQIEKNRVRMETGAGEAVVFDGTKQILQLIHVDRKAYTEVSKAEMDRMNAQMTAAMNQVNSLPPDQRAQFQAMMQGRMGVMAPPPKPEFKRAGTDKVGKWTCDKYEGFVNGQKTTEVCTVDPAALGFVAADFEITRQLSEFFKKIMPQSADQLFTIGRAEDQGFAGVPIKRVMTIGGQQTTTELVELSRQTFPDSVFAVPSDFKKEEFSAGRGRGGQ
jgi:uncharacterized protein DUF4412